MIDFAEKLMRATSQEESWFAFQGELASYGLAAAKYGFMPMASPDALSREVIYLGDYGLPEFEEWYEKGGWAAHDLTLHHCITSTGAMSWAELGNQIASEPNLNQRSRELHQLSFEAGLVNGLMVPLRDNTPFSRGGLSFMGDPYENTESFNRFLAENLPSLSLMAEVFHANLQRRFLVPEDQQLSTRQKECLLWSMYGLQVQQVADRIGAHPKTVEKHLAAARSKLRARTTTQAAVTAMTLGLIDP